MAKVRSDGGGAAKRAGRPAQPKPKARPKGGGGGQLAKLAGDVSRNYARGADRVGKALNAAIPSRQASSTVSKAMRDSAAVRKALGRK